jgi:hypothetical protein
MKLTRSQIINAFIKKYGYTSYLEIGVNTPAQPGYNWNNVNIELKHGVDPAEKAAATFKMPSDEFFAHHVNMKYDIVFVDGLHLFEQAYRDIVNSLKWLNDNGTIVVHDCNPTEEITQRRERASSAWHGDVWKAILKLRMEDPTISIFTIDADEGCTVIRKGSQELFKTSEPESVIYDFNFFDANRKEILNMKSVREFKEMMGMSGFMSLLKRILIRS